jgi:hypothetical protein
MSTSTPPPPHDAPGPAALYSASASEPPAPRPKKKTSTLTIVLAVIGGGLMLLFLGLGIAAYLLLSSPEGRAIAGVVGEAVKISSKAQKAPGTKELRAMGCKQAMVMDLDDLGKMMSFLDAGTPSGESAPFGEMVVCSVNPWGTPPKCEDIAARYVSTVGTRSKPFVVNVQQAGKGKAECTLLYDGDGKLLENFDARTAPVPPLPAD